MIILKKEKNTIFNWCFYNIKLKYKFLYDFFKIIYFEGKNGFLKILINNDINIHYLKNKFNNLKISLNIGYIGYLYLNGTGFKCTKKFIYINKCFWRFNVGHSQVLLYYPPRDIIMKVRQRFICFFGVKKHQIFDLANKLKNFRIPDSYKGVGIKFPDETIILKKGKTKQ